MADVQVSHEKRKIYNWRAVVPGDVHGDWTITGEGEPFFNGKGHATRRWTAICVCGESGIFTSYALKNNKNKCRHGDNSLKQDIVIGTIFGRLRTLDKSQKYRGETVVPCICECGMRTKTKRTGLVSGMVTACTKCMYAKANDGERNKTHGLSRHPDYNIWGGMKQRCLIPTNPAYHLYGGRGITIADRWMNFNNFISDMGKRPEGTSLERVDVNKGYGPENCVWADKGAQAINKQANALITINGMEMTAKDIERETGLSHKWICRQRSKDKMPGETIIRKAIEALERLLKS